MTQPYAIGLQTQPNEIRVEQLPVRGTLPGWLRGTLLRNGPGQFEVGQKGMRHWFDGPAQVHKFSFQNGQVNYANKFLQTRTYQSIQAGKIAYQEFATDPCRSFFQRMMAVFQNDPTDNTNVNITKLAGKVVAITELPMAVEFDPETLETLRHVAFNDDIKGTTNTPHPHFDPRRGQAINETTRFGLKNQYHVYRMAAGETKRHLIGTVDTKTPAYMHSFALTENYVVLVEFSMFPNALRLLQGSTFGDALEFRSNVPSRIFIVQRQDGSLLKTLEAEPFFAFHHVNAYEQGNEIVMDVVAYPDGEIVRALYLDALRTSTPQIGHVRRYRLNLSGGVHASYETLNDTPLELPRIAYEGHNGLPYRYTYGISARSGGFMNQLVKLDVETRAATTWHEAGCHPGEPVFVAQPGAAAEDDGVVLSVVLDTAQGNSFLLALDAATFTEIARATVPQVVPLGFHGIYTERD
ncbi:MAG: carotenoid oxygenase family protein [bacterium]|nr:carotenoid oxygenase family protein [bacterium]